MPAAAAFLLISVLALKACSRESDEIVSTGTIPMTQAKVAVTTGITLPPTTGNGTVTATYNKTTDLLSYTITWDTLSAAPVAIHLHAVADEGTIALPSPLGPFGIDSFRVNTTTWVKYVGGIAQRFNFTSSSGLTKKGTFSNTLFADGVVIKEDDILAGKYYVDIHTASNPLFIAFGEIRAQLVFQQ